MIFSAPTLIRLLARFADRDAPAPARSLSESLSQWLGWTDAIALSTALKAGSASDAGQAHVASQDPSSLVAREQREFDRVRASLANAIASQGVPKPVQGRSARGMAAPRPRDLDVDFVIHRQRYTALQHTMDNSITPLRARLRTTLAACSPQMNRLAVMDALMEQVLDARQRSLLAGVPAMLATHFERLQLAQEGNWVDVFRRDMQSVLLAELDIRLHPAQGLMAALRAC